jgi:hypothetical protein
MGNLVIKAGAQALGHLTLDAKQGVENGPL